MPQKWFKSKGTHSLLKFGYSPKKPVDARRRALRKAINSYGATIVFHKLNGLANVTSSSQPTNSDRYRADANFVSGEYL